MFYRQRIKLLFFKIFLFLFCPFYRYRTSFPKEKRKRIVLLRNDALGDFLVFLYSAFALRKALPIREYCISIFVTQINYDWAKKSRLFDEVFLLSKNGTKMSVRQRIKLYAFFYSLPTEIFFNTLHGRDGDSDLLAYSSRAKFKYAFSFAAWKHPFSDTIRFYERVYTKTLPLAKEKSLIDSTCALLQLAFHENIVPEALSPEQIRFLEDDTFLIENLPRPYCVLVPGAAVRERQWSPSCFAELASLLKRKYRCKIVVTGTASENMLALEIAKTTDIINLCGKLSLPQLASVLKEAFLCVSNDTGSAHIASVLSVPTFCILSGQHYGLYAPCQYRKELHVITHLKPCFSCNGICMKKEKTDIFPCITEISPQEVFQTIKNVL